MNCIHSKRYAVFLNVVIPLLLGVTIYAVLTPSIIAFSFLPFHWDAVVNSSHTIVRIIRNYVPDFLWAYSFTFWLLSRCNNSKFQILIALLAVVIEITLECIQLSPNIKMTFDIWDVVVEVLASLIAFCSARISLWS